MSGIDPKKGTAGGEDFTVSVTGTGFLADAAVGLVRGTDTIPASKATVVHSTKTTCMFHLPQELQAGKWEVVVTNPDGQTGILTEGFEIEPAEETVLAKPMPEQGSGSA